MPGMVYIPGEQPQQSAFLPPVQPTPPKKSHSGLIVGLVAVGLAVLLAGGTVTWLAFFRNAEQKQAISQCETRIKSMLKTPATAKFSDEGIDRVPPDGWNVTGAVDAENSFSALVRNQWDCYAHKNADGTWDVRPSILSN